MLAKSHFFNLPFIIGYDFTEKHSFLDYLLRLRFRESTDGPIKDTFVLLP